MIKKLISTLTYPNLKLIEKYVSKTKNHDLIATQTTVFLKQPTDLMRDYEKIPNRLHVPDSLANSKNPNITKPTQPTTSLGLVGLYNLGNTCFINTAI
jgi:ubiquitin C-terminal hydrolase